tara:strand:- start:163 stop:438 length:276 start_codon:yes stop_codon:yes gene_type:complete
VDEDDWGESGPTLGEDLAKLKDEISSLADEVSSLKYSIGQIDLCLSPLVDQLKSLRGVGPSHAMTTPPHGIDYLTETIEDLIMVIQKKEEI